MNTQSDIPLAPSADEIPAAPRRSRRAKKPEVAPLSTSADQQEAVFEQEANQAREQAWDLAAEPYFGEDMPLHPWSRERHLLARRLISMDVPGPPLEELGRLQERAAQWAAEKGVEVPALTDFVDVLPYVPAAEKILYFAAHEPHQFAHLRGPRVDRFFTEIAKWSEANIRPDQFELACLTALQITTQHEKVTAMPQPSKKGRRDSGN